MDSLPSELVQKCLEFLPFAEVHAEVKQVSKATRRAARRALTRGRWRPVKYVAEQGLDVCAATGCLGNGRGLGANARVGDAASAVPAAACATFREAWTLDRSLVMRIICKDRGPGTYGEAYQACFLRIVEPSIDGLSRIIGARENAAQGSSLYYPERLIQTWANSLPGGQASRFTLSLSGPAVGDGLMDWADPSNAVTLMHGLLDVWDCDIYTNGNLLDATARAWSANWADRAKADRFVAAAVDHREMLEYEERREQELLEEDSYDSDDGFIPTNSPPRCLPSPRMYGAVRVEETGNIFSCGSCGVQIQVVGGAAVTGAQFMCPQCGETNTIN